MMNESCKKCVYIRKLKLFDEKFKYVDSGYCCIMFEKIGEKNPPVYQVMENDMCEMFVEARN